MALPPVTEMTPQDRNTLRSLLTQLQPYVDESTPQGQAIKERDHYARMWDDVMQEVLKNLQSIRDEQTRLRHDLQDAGEAGTKDTERVIKEIAMLHNTLRADQRARENAKPTQPNNEPWWRFW